MLSFIAKSKPCWIFILIVLAHAAAAATLKTDPPWGWAGLLLAMVMYLYIVSELAHKFHGKPTSPWDVLRFEFFGYLAMFPIVLLAILPFAPFYALGMNDVDNPVVNLLMSPITIVAKCWLGVGILLSVYTKDQVGAVGRSKRLIQKHFFDFSLPFILVALNIFFEILINFGHKEPWERMVLLNPLGYILDCIVIPYLYFEKFKMIGVEADPPETTGPNI